MADTAMMVEDVAAERPVGDTGENCTCCGCTWKKNYVVLTRMVGVLVSLAVVVIDIVTFINACCNPADMLTRGYVVIMAFLAILAEMRFWGPCNTCGWTCLKYFYFACTYPGKAIWYIMLGTLMMRSDTFNLIAGIVVTVVGLANLALAAVFRSKLPTYTDEEQMNFLLYGEEEAPPGYNKSQRGGGGGYSPPAGAAGHQSDMETGMAVAQLAYDNRQHITKENVDAAAKFAQKNKKHLNKENLETAGKVANMMYK